MPFTIKIEKEAEQDIQQGINWYNEQEPGLGRTFHTAVKQHFKKLRINPFFQVRYDNIHCLPLKRFPFMIHYTIHEERQIVIVRAVLNTFRSPRTWQSRK
jgi:toxin ParE1/3/4